MNRRGFVTTMGRPSDELHEGGLRIMWRDAEAEQMQAQSARGSALVWPADRYSPLRTAAEAR